MGCHSTWIARCGCPSGMATHFVLLCCCCGRAEHLTPGLTVSCGFEKAHRHGRVFCRRPTALPGNAWSSTTPCIALHPRLTMCVCGHIEGPIQVATCSCHRPPSTTTTASTSRKVQVVGARIIWIQAMPTVLRFFVVVGHPINCPHTSIRYLKFNFARRTGPVRGSCCTICTSL